MSLESYKDLILYRVDVWWKRDLENTDKKIHSKRDCIRTLSLDLLKQKKNLVLLSILEKEI